MVILSKFLDGTWEQVHLNDFLDSLNDAKLDLMVYVNSRAEARYEKTLRKLYKFQVNYEVAKLRYA